MKTCSNILSYQHFIDLAPLAARYEVLTRAVLAYLAAGQLGLVLRYTRKVVRLVQVFTRLEAQNILLARKLEMLSHAPWRDRVLRELGGVRRLKMWEAAQRRIEQRVLARRDRPTIKPQSSESSWLYTPERVAESERLKAHARKCARAGVSPNIYRDRVKMDFDGEFRLPPLPRERAASRQAKVYTQNSIVDYDFNGIPFGEVKGFGPAMVWPVEFYAAAALEAGDTQPRYTDANPDCQVAMPEPDPQMPSESMPQYHGMDSGVFLASQSHGRNDRVETPKTPLHQALPIKTYRYIFEDPV